MLSKQSEPRGRNSLHTGTTPIKLALRPVYNSAAHGTENLPRQPSVTIVMGCSGNENRKGSIPPSLFQHEYLQRRWCHRDSCCKEAFLKTPPQDHSWHRATLHSINQSEFPMNHTHTQWQQTAAAFCLQSGQQQQQQQRYICIHMHSDFTQAQPM